MWLSVLKSRVSERTGLLGTNVMRKSMLMGVHPAANFAKFDRSKPHLNVGTIGTFFASFDYI